LSYLIDNSAAMKKLDSTIPCPACKGPLSPRVLHCRPCDLRVEGDFRTNEFASLDPELLHVLRIFVVCEGRIKDMEKALGVSYPTVKAHIARLKQALGHNAEPEPEAPSDQAAILSALERGEITYDRSLELLRAAKKGR